MVGMHGALQPGQSVLAQATAAACAPRAQTLLEDAPQRGDLRVGRQPAGGRAHSAALAQRGARVRHILHAARGRLAALRCQQALDQEARRLRARRLAHAAAPAQAVQADAGGGRTTDSTKSTLEHLCLRQARTQPRTTHEEPSYKPSADTFIHG